MLTLIAAKSTYIVMEIAARIGGPSTAFPLNRGNFPDLSIIDSNKLLAARSRAGYHNQLAVRFLSSPISMQKLHSRVFIPIVPRYRLDQSMDLSRHDFSPSAHTWILVLISVIGISRMYGNDRSPMIFQPVRPIEINMWQIYVSGRFLFYSVNHGGYSGVQKYSATL